MTPRCRFCTASVTALPPASSPSPGLRCSCPSCCCRPSDLGRRVSPEDRNRAEEAEAGTPHLSWGPAPVLGTTPTKCTSCHPAASKRVSIKGFNPPEVGKPGSAIPASPSEGRTKRDSPYPAVPALTPKPKQTKLCSHGLLGSTRWELSWKGPGSCGRTRNLAKMPLPRRARMPGRTEEKRELAACSRDRRGRMLGRPPPLPPAERPPRDV